MIEALLNFPGHIIKMYLKSQHQEAQYFAFLELLWY